MFSPLLLPAVLALATPSAQVAVPAASPFTPTGDRIAITQSVADSAQPICYKMRTYIFERNDDAAPKFVRETTCGPARPRLNRSRMPKVRLVPAN